MEITRDDMQRFINCQMSGVTNMFDVTTVENKTGLDREKILYIMDRYQTLKDELGFE